MDSQTALRTAHVIALTQSAVLPIAEIETRIVAMCLRDLRRSHQRDFINLLPVLTSEETRALYRFLIDEFVAAQATMAVAA